MKTLVERPFLTRRGSTVRARERLPQSTTQYHSVSGRLDRSVYSLFSSYNFPRYPPFSRIRWGEIGGKKRNTADAGRDTWNGVDDHHCIGWFPKSLSQKSIESPSAEISRHRSRALSATHSSELIKALGKEAPNTPIPMQSPGRRGRAYARPHGRGTAWHGSTSRQASWANAHFRIFSSSLGVGTAH